ncbi:ABC transporter permease [Candidatus Saccharibacteria bacterium]|nr:ABC transporter permease [Candidatus Saccharibacteria bacterium]
MKALYTAARVLKQLAHDPRTLVLIFAVPPLLLWLLKYVFNNDLFFTQFAPLMLGIFPMIMMFLITSIATLRERKSGTLSRLMSMPLRKSDFIFGYALAFSLVAAIQAVLATLVMIYGLGIEIGGGTSFAIIAAVASALLGTTMGLFTSAFARTEFQAIQFMPALLFPQILLCGLFVARDQMATVLARISDWLPLTYSSDLMKRIAAGGSWGVDHTKDLIIICGFIIGFLLIGALTIRRQEKTK